MNVPNQDERGTRSSFTKDDFLGGRIRLMQPRSGFRAGLDTVLLAASVSPSTTAFLELGCGSAAASCCALADLPHADAVLVERDADMAALARRNLRENGFDQRAAVLDLDVTAPGKIRSAAGLPSDRFSSVIANPPFFENGTHAPDPSRARARHMNRENLDQWVKTAAASAAPRGEVIFIHVIDALPDLVASFNSRFGAICLWPIVPRPGDGASRLLIRGIKGSRAPMQLLSPLVLHDATGNAFQPEVDAIFRGMRRLDW